ncbi:MULTISPECIES: flagellar basal body rod protein FlgB [Devosia]|uniref:Flagellar basal body rod protein FlgB n=1 Tax=Devosia equisanguinis TaxID=2490941 RepID=A0A447IG42_9HYPH|nr:MULTISPECIES: flagellar basal body rod protein FlgB [Devosia]ODT50003.1 MAG: flagellar basal-body rod protein FlgB [Pelagibacterium sp. SCN 63-126]ODU81297.1 MAG: flagellar basal-body rod protein FlgB [Pelagibacterium sp. SCN 63-17]OJX45314.1 MAG: flagellar basal-body rod protein FlgB [Devosia sp. 63-57]VDS06453.1 flagellar basal body rod protein FlgB [Devosia equisanguinis]
MGLMDMPVFSALTDKMKWHQARQGLLAENVANSETPGYKGRDLKQYSFADRVSAMSSAQITTLATQPMHFSVSSEAGAFGAQHMANFEVTPEGNGITLEDEMMKVTTNMMDYQAATSIYQKSIRILRVALGKNA